MCSGTASAVVIDFEGIAPAGGQTTESGATRTFNGYDVVTQHGHYVDSAQGAATRPSNGTDWLLHDHADGLSPNTPVVITRSGGGAFDALGLDVSEWDNRFALGQTLTATGFFSGGGSIVANIVTDQVFGFETVALTGFTNLTTLWLIGSSANTGPCSGFTVCGSLAYDNIVVRDVVVPAPATAFMLGLSLLGLGAARRRS